MSSNTSPAPWFSDTGRNAVYDKRGLCFATKEDAIAAAKAMLPVKGGVQ